MTVPYLSVKSILHELSLVIDERYWNETTMLEWATRALRQMNVEPALEKTVALLEICEHKATLPTDLRYLTQIMYKHTSDTLASASIIADLNLPENSELVNTTLNSFGWSAMRMTTNPYHDSICLNESLINCSECKHEFTVSPSMILTSTLRNGIILVSYLRYPVDSEGYPLIPDDETLKEAILHYVLYRYWMSKYQMKEEGAEGRIKFHLDMWDTLSKKALNLNLPDVNQMENLMNIRNRLVPRSRRFAQGFTTLGNQEYVSH